MSAPADLYAAATLHRQHFVGWTERHAAVLAEGQRLLRLAAIRGWADDPAVREAARLVARLEEGERTC